MQSREGENRRSCCVGEDGQDGGAIASDAKSPEENDDCAEDEEGKHAQPGEGQVPTQVSAVIQDVIADNVVVVAFRIVGRQMPEPFAG